MGVWVVSLSTHQLSPTRLTRKLKCMYSEFDRRRPLAKPTTIQCSTPYTYTFRYTQIYFGENQLSPSSFGILPLTTNHPKSLLRSRVRSSCSLSRTFNLFMVSSPGFGSNPIVLIAHFRHAFTPPTLRNSLDLTIRITHRFILQ